MKKRNKLFWVLCIILAVTMCLSACGTTPTPDLTPTPRPTPPTENLVDVTDKVDRDTVIKDPPVVVDASAFDGDPETTSYWLTEQSWPVEYACLRWKTTEPITISAYCFENICGREDNADGGTISWELYGITKDAKQVLLDIVTKEEPQKNKTRLYTTDTLQEFSHFKLIITSNTCPRIDKYYREWCIGEITLYEEIPVEKNDI